MEEGHATYKRPVSSGLFYLFLATKTAHHYTDMDVVPSLTYEPLYHVVLFQVISDTADAIPFIILFHRQDVLWDAQAFLNLPVALIFPVKPMNRFVD